MKVYLSKSKQCNPDLVISVTQLIKESIPNVEILSYTGGQYNPNLIFQADMVITIPAVPCKEDVLKASVMLGRGGFDESQSFEQQNPSKVAIVAFDKGQNVLERKHLKCIVDNNYTITEENWQTNWGIATGTIMELKEFLAPKPNTFYDPNSLEAEDDLESLFN